MTDILMQLFCQSTHAEQHTRHDHAKRPRVDFDKGQVALLSSAFFPSDFSHLIQNCKKLIDCYQLLFWNLINYIPDIIQLYKL